MKSIQSLSKRNLCIYIVLIGFVFGVFVASLVHISPLVSILVLLTAFVIYFADKNIFILLALLSIALGIFRFDVKDFHVLAPPGNTGVVVTEPEHRENDIRFVVKTNTGEKILMTTNLWEKVQYGDEISFTGNAKKPEGDYAKYLSKDDIYYVVNYAKIQLPAHGQAPGNSRSIGFWLVSHLLDVKSAFVSQMKKILPEPESSLLAGLVVAGKQALSADILADFRRAGVIHIVVLSGYNLTVIAEFFLVSLAFLGRRRAALISVVAIALFTLMTGAEATVLRAAIMVTLLFIGRVYGREGNAPRILLFTAVCMLLWNPKDLVYNASFQLSFLAMVALIYVAPIVQHHAERILPAHGRASGNSRSISSRLLELISTTLATQLVVFPFLLYNMGNFSLVFLLSNLLILLVIPYTMLVGFAATVLAFVSTVLAWPLAYITNLLLKWILFVAHTLGSLSFASVQIDNFPLWGCLLLYAVIGTILWRSRSSLQPLPSLS